MKRYSAEGGLLTTSPDEMSAFLDNGNYYRVTEWAEMPEEIKMDKKENDNALLEFMLTAPVSFNDMKNPVVRYRRDGALATYTKLTAAFSSSAETVSVEDASIFNTNHVAVIIRTGEELKISSINATNNTITLQAGSRGLMGPAFAALAGDEIRPGNSWIGERGSMPEGYSSYPGDPSYNLITISGQRFGMSTMQREAAMKGDWGTWDRLTMDTKFQVETKIQEAMLSQHRFTYYDSDQKQVYRGAGLIHQCSGNVLDLGIKGTNFLWEYLNDFLTPMYVSDLSADNKEIFCGPNLWADALSTSKQMSPQVDMLGINATTGAMQFQIQLTNGKTATFNKVTGFEGERANFGIALDPANIGGGQYSGLGPQWRYDIQDPSDVLGQDAAYFTSWECHIYDRSTCGVIRGGTKPITV